jgi:hypothetical protein
MPRWHGRFNFDHGRLYSLPPGPDASLRSTSIHDRSIAFTQLVLPRVSFFRLPRTSGRAIFRVELNLPSPRRAASGHKVSQNAVSHQHRGAGVSTRIQSRTALAYFTAKVHNRARQSLLRRCIAKRTRPARHYISTRQRCIARHGSLRCEAKLLGKLRFKNPFNIIIFSIQSNGHTMLQHRILWTSLISYI